MIALYRTSSGDAEPACRFCACSQSWLHSGVPQRQSLREIHKEPGQCGALVPCHHLDRHYGNLLCFCHAEVRGCMTHLAAASSTYLRLSLPHRQHQARSSTGIHVHTGQRIRPSVAYRPRQYICSGNLLHCPGQACNDQGDADAEAAGPAGDPPLHLGGGHDVFPPPRQAHRWVWQCTVHFTGTGNFVWLMASKYAAEKRKKWNFWLELPTCCASAAGAVDHLRAPR